MSDARFAIDYGKRNAKCQMSKCKQQIEKGHLRIAKIVKSPFSDDGDMKQFHHPGCLFDAFKRARVTTKVIHDPSDIEGWAEVKDADKPTVLALINDLETFRAAADSSGGKKKAARGTPQKKPKEEPVSTVPAAEAAEAHHELFEPGRSEGRHKDDALREFRRLCASVADEPSHISKTELFRKFFAKGTDGTKFGGDLLVWTRLLLPGVIKRVYNLQSRQLVKIFSRILLTSEDEMLTDLEKGDVAETISSFFQQSASSKVKPCTKSRLTVQDVDSFLNSLTSLTREAEQEAAFARFAPHCTANDVKMLVRFIKGDLRMGAGAKPVLESLHKDAYEAFNSSRNIEAVIGQILELRKNFGSSNVDGRPLDVGATLMMPIQPMLAAPCRSVEMAFSKCKNGIYSEIKYDGERVQLHKRGGEIRYFSRSLKPVLPHKVKHFKDSIGKAFPGADDLILDAEVLMIDNKTGLPLPFGTLGVHKAAGYTDAQPCLFVFDCIYYNGTNYMNKSVEERRKMLESKMVQVGNSIKFSQLKSVKTPQQLKEMISDVLSQGLEGLVLKDRLSTYEPGKRHWLKVKKDYLDDGAMADSADLVVLGAWYGTGNRGGIMSVFLMGCYDETSGRWCTVTKVHSGFDDNALNGLQTELGDKMVKIKGNQDKVPEWLSCTRQMVPDFVIKDPKDSPVWEVTGAEFSKAEIHTADGISIRFPRVTKLRQDKDWKSATSLDQLKRLFEASKEVTDVKVNADERKRKGISDEDDVENTPEKRPKREQLPSNVSSPIRSPKLDEKPEPKTSTTAATVTGRSYDKRHVETEHGFVLNVISAKENESSRQPNKNMLRFVCKHEEVQEVGQVVGISGDVYDVVVKLESGQETSYESVRKCLVEFRNQTHRANLKSLCVVVDTASKTSNLYGLSINALRTLIKNVFYKESGVTMTMVCPGLGPAPDGMNSSSQQQPKRAKSTNNNNSSTSTTKVEYPFLKVHEGQKLTKVSKQPK